MDEYESIVIPRYMTQGFLCCILFFGTAITWAGYNPYADYTSTYQHLCVLGCVSLCYTMFFWAVDLFTGLRIMAYQFHMRWLNAFLLNLGIIFVIYLIGAAFFNFNGVLWFN